MKATRYQGDNERLILLGLVTNSAILSKVLTGLKTEKQPFQSKWSNVVFNWCREYHKQFGKAPRKAVSSLYRAYASKHEDEPETPLIEKFLVSLDEQFQQMTQGLNPDYVIDLAAKHFSLIKYGRLRDDLEETLLTQDLQQVQETLAKFTPVRFESSDVVDVLTDVDTWTEALAEEEQDVLITYPGALGEFFNNNLAREGFIAFMAPEKRGKTFWLVDVAWRALREKRRVLFVSAGDMSRRGMLRRLGIRAARRPIEAGTVRKPRRMILSVTKQPKVKFEEEIYEKRISIRRWREVQAEVHQLSSSQESLLKLSCHSNSSLTVEGLRSELDKLIKEGWVPDVVVLDYMDILAPETGSKGQDFRHQTNESWKAFRRMTQDYKILGVTATQSDAASYDRETITRSNFSEDKRKLSHITGMIGINQTEEEKKMGIYRLNWVALREGLYYESRCCYSAGCLALANPAMKSVW